MLVKVIFFCKGPGLGQISGLLGHGPRKNFSSLGAIAAEKYETDGRTDGQTDGRADGRTDDITISVEPFF
jgi:hypothetical protein